jgi:lipopolysaccharide/colanic/teichoic acid biosynthesis glycosyltransferase
MSDHSVPTLDEVLHVLGTSPEEIADWSSTVAELETRDSDKRWSNAQEALSATSTIGPLFGVTDRDLRNAASRLSRKGISPSARRGKRIFDVVVSLLILIGAFPVLVAAAAAIKLSSKGPVFYRSERVGLNGERFGMIKFRTMKLDSGPLDVQPKFDQVLFKWEQDPRVTRVGRVLRRYSIDDLPQLFNVLIGQMSIVGPRPPLPQEITNLATTPAYLARPGITGLWQVSGRSDLTWEDTVRLDTIFLENWSVTNDVLIIMKTLRNVSNGPFVPSIRFVKRLP